MGKYTGKIEDKEEIANKKIRLRGKSSSDRKTMKISTRKIVTVLSTAPYCIYELRSRTHRRRRSSSNSLSSLERCRSKETTMLEDLINRTSSIPETEAVDISDKASSREVETKKLERSTMDGQIYATTKSTVQITPIAMPPTKSEIDDFFSAAEKALQKRFSDRYNFDVVRDVPLEGRYEWVQIKR